MVKIIEGYRGDGKGKRSCQKDFGRGGVYLREWRSRKPPPPRYEWTRHTMHTRPGQPHFDEFADEKRRSGVSPDETWNLDVSIATFLVPRLRKFRELTDKYPAVGGVPTMEAWHGILDRTIAAFEALMDDEPHGITDEERKERDAMINEGIALFAKYLRGMWW